MKEITTQLMLDVTLIDQYDEESSAKLLENCRDEDFLRKFADAIKETLVADKVDIVGVKNFVRDMPDEEVME